MTELHWILIGVASNLLLAAGAYLKRALTLGGAAAAVCIGSGVFAAGGFYFWSILVVFFLTSTVLSRIKDDSKQRMTEITGRGNRRDALQAFANGGAALCFALAYRFTDQEAFMAAFASALAAANADTWASELGILSRGATVSILDLKPVPPGTSGGVSLLGLAASFIGASAIGAVVLLGDSVSGFGLKAPITSALLATTAGVLGSLIDSLLGASIQARYLVGETGEASEKRFTGGRKNILVRGVPIINNDAVNFLSTAAAAVCAVLVYIAVV